MKIEKEIRQSQKTDSESGFFHQENKPEIFLLVTENGYKNTTLI